MRKLAVVLLLPLSLFAQEYMGEFSIDTNVYDISFYLIASGFRGPQDISMPAYVNERLYGYQKKGTNQVDVFSVIFEKIGSFTIPNNPAGTFIRRLSFNQTFLDNDVGWESLILYMDSTTGVTQSKVIDETGATLLADTSWGEFGFDGQNTYIYFSYPVKVWKFRTNISPTSQPLSKTSATSRPMMTYMPSGDFRVSLQPANGGTSVQIFDFLGRQVFRKTIQNINKPTSFTIPSSEMPNSPFVTRVQNGNGSFVKKEVSVR